MLSDTACSVECVEFLFAGVTGRAARMRRYETNGKILSQGSVQRERQNSRGFNVHQGWCEAQVVEQHLSAHAFHFPTEHITYCTLQN